MILTAGGVGCMHALITFYKGKRELTAFPYPIEKPEDYAAAINAA